GFRQRTLLEEVAVAVAVDHLRPVPERVVEAAAVVNAGDQLHARVVDAVAFEDVAVEVVRRLGRVVDLVDRGVGGRRVAATAGEVAREGGVAAAFGVVDRLQGGFRFGGGGGELGKGDRAHLGQLPGDPTDQGTTGTHRGRRGDRLQGRLTL